MKVRGTYIVQPHKHTTEIIVHVGLEVGNHYSDFIFRICLLGLQNQHVRFCLFSGVPEEGDGCLCPDQFQRLLRSCYRFTTDGMSFSQCRRLCSDQGALMLELDTIEEMWGVAAIAPS